MSSSTAQEGTLVACPWRTGAVLSLAAHHHTQPAKPLGQWPAGCTTSENAGLSVALTCWARRQVLLSNNEPCVQMLQHSPLSEVQCIVVADPLCEPVVCLTVQVYHTL